jgi:ATP-dependent DNA helicase RecG
MFADRLEVENPGGLYGGVTIDKLQEGQSTRNRLLVQLMEDMHLVENRGSGIDAMLDAMQKRGLPAPVFEDKRTSFLVEVLSGDDCGAFRGGAESILAYVKEHGSIKRADCQQLLGVDEIKAKYILRKMRDARLLLQEGTRRGAHYVLARRGH